MTSTVSASRRRWVAAGCMAAVAVPFLLVRFPPITDLPQHAAQIRLLLEALRSAESPYAVQWLTPYGLSYSLMGAAWALSGPVLAGRLAFLALALLWVGAVHLLAAWHGRPLAQAVLASALVFNHALYWGFFSFLFGWALFVLWMRATVPSEALTPRRALGFTGLAFLLYLSHALWFAAAVVWLGIDGLRARIGWRAQVLRGFTVVPVAALAAFWFTRLQGRSFESGTVWMSPLARLAPTAIRDAVLGGLQGPAESLFLSAVGIWCAVALVQGRDGWRERIDTRLLALAAMFFALYLVLPVKFQNTIRFGERWLPLAAVGLVLALPAPSRRGRGLVVLPGALLALFCGTTAAYWMAFEAGEMSGMEEALAALPEAPRVLGLSYSQSSPLLKTYPFVQDFAYAQVRRGGTLSFSFADFAPSLVVYRPPRHIDWTPALEFLPERVRPEDVVHFDFALVRADENTQREVSRRLGLLPATASGVWRLYRVADPLPAR